MAHHNIATSGASQNNISMEIAPRRTYYMSTNVTNVILAQQSGSPFVTRHSFEKLLALIKAFGGSDIEAKRYHGNDLYGRNIGTYINNYGDIEQIFMSDIVSRRGEEPSSLDSIIICLSVAMGPPGITSIVASATMLHKNEARDASLDSLTGVLQKQIKEHVLNVLSRDGMCNKLEHAKQDAKELLCKKARHVPKHSLFMPPRMPAEEWDYAEFIVRLWSSKADGEKIYIRSVKLLALSLLLCQYGWQIGVFAENNEGRLFEIVRDTGALSVIYSSSQRADEGREYVENHCHKPTPAQELTFYPTAVCRAANWVEVACLSLAETDEHQALLMQGRDALNKYWDDNNPYFLRVGSGVLLYSSHNVDKRLCRESTHMRAVQRLFPRWSSATIGLVTAAALMEYFPSGLELSETEFPTVEDNDTSLVTMLANKTHRLDIFLPIVGAALATLDRSMKLIVDTTPHSLVRTPTGHGIRMFIKHSSVYMDLLTETIGVNSLVRFCAMGLAGVNPVKGESPTTSAARIGYWGGQQGLLVTSVFKRAPYESNSTNDLKPLSFYNVPIIGIPTDHVGWIHAGIVGKAVERKLTPSNIPGRLCNVIIEYRPHFEKDSSTVVAAAYVDGVFRQLLPIDILSDYNYASFTCGEMPYTTYPAEGIKFISIANMEPGETIVPRDQADKVVIVHQQNETSRWFSLQAYRDHDPIVHFGCAPCKLEWPMHEQGGIAIPCINWLQRQESSDTIALNTAE